MKKREVVNMKAEPGAVVVSYILVSAGLAVATVTLIAWLAGG